MSITPPTDQAICAWYESQSEEILRDLQDRFDADTPRQAWEAFFKDCPPPAPEGPSDSLAAPAAAGQGAGNHLAAARTVQWLLGDLFCLADDGSPEEHALLKASIEQDLRVLGMECVA